MRANLNLLALAVILVSSLASVSAFSLSDIEALPSNTATPGCETTYSTPIDACSSTYDFVVHEYCSSSCQTALSERAAQIILSCRQAYISPDSLIRRILNGEIIITLCPTASSSSSAAAVSSSVTEATSYAAAASSSEIKATSYAAAASSSVSIATSYAAAASSPVSIAPSYAAAAPSTASISPSSAVTAYSLEASSTAAAVSSSSAKYTQPTISSGFLTVTASSYSASDIPNLLEFDTSATPTPTGDVPTLLTQSAIVTESSTASRSASSTARASTSSGSPSRSATSAFASSSSTTSGAVAGARAGWSVIAVGVVAAVGLLLY
ncbi:hypothetical protein RUND412_005430 [Rhizina undulata]